MSTNEKSPHRHNHRHQRKLLCQSLLAIFIATVLTFTLFLAYHYYTLATAADDAAGALFSRAVSHHSNNGSFVNHKLYLIVIFIGLLVVFILGILLSAWCCRSSFENPICIPCYLCACCGGLACLECIACGLCVEAAEQA